MSTVRDNFGFLSHLTDNFSPPFLRAQLTNYTTVFCSIKSSFIIILSSVYYTEKFNLLVASSIFRFLFLGQDHLTAVILYPLPTPDAVAAHTKIKEKIPAPVIYHFQPMLSLPIKINFKTNTNRTRDTT